MKCFGIFNLFSKNSSLGAPCAANLWIRPLFVMDLITRSIAEFAMDVYGKVLNSYWLFRDNFLSLRAKAVPSRQFERSEFYCLNSFWYKCYLPYARHYNPRFVYFLPTFWSPKTFFQGSFLLKFWPYVRLVFKSGL